MEYPHDTPLTRKNKHLSPYERGQIKLLYDQGRTAYAIAKIPGRAQNTIRNELARGTVEQIKDKKHSLDAVVGQAKTKKLFLADEMVCTKTLCNYVEQGLLPIRNIDLPRKVLGYQTPHEAFLAELAALSFA